MIVSAVIVYPAFYYQILQGLTAADRELIEIADVFAMTTKDRIRHIYLPALNPFLLSALQSGIGMAWKAGVAAEVIGQRTGTLGNELYRAKALLATDHLFAVTVSIVVLSFCTEKIVIFLFSYAARYMKE